MNTRAFPSQNYCIQGSSTNVCKNNYARNLATYSQEYLDCVFNPITPYQVCKRAFDYRLRSLTNQALRCAERQGPGYNIYRP